MGKALGAGKPYPLGPIEGEYLETLRNRIFKGDWLKNIPENSFAKPWFRTIELIEAEKLSDTVARIAYRFPVELRYCNPMPGLHGGAQATFFDMCTNWTLGLIARPGFWSSSVTRTLNVTYFRPPVPGEMLRMECEIVHVGKRMCMIKGVLKRERDGAIMSSCEHGKFNLDTDNGKM